MVTSTHFAYPTTKTLRFSEKSPVLSLRIFRGFASSISSELEDTEVEVWETDSTCGLSISTEASVDDSEEKREATRAWLLENTTRFKAAVQPHLDRAIAELPNNEEAEDPAPMEIISDG